MSLDIRPVIGISGSYNESEETHLIRNTYFSAIMQHGGLPVLLPMINDEGTANAYLDMIDGILFSGGGDIEAARFGEEQMPESGAPNRTRDTSELLFLPLAVKRSMPVFGICRGVQALNVALGGTIYQDIPAQLGIPRSEHYQEKPFSTPFHEVYFEKGGLFERITNQSSMPTNSMHHQSIKALSDALVVEGRTKDGVIEAVSGKDNDSIIGVQFHPEYLVEGNQQAAALFDHFISRAKQYRAKQHR